MSGPNLLSAPAMRDETAASAVGRESKGATDGIPNEWRGLHPDFLRQLTAQPKRESDSPALIALEQGRSAQRDIPLLETTAPMSYSQAAQNFSERFQSFYPDLNLPDFKARLETTYRSYKAAGDKLESEQADEVLGRRLMTSRIDPKSAVNYTDEQIAAASDALSKTTTYAKMVLRVEEIERSKLPDEEKRAIYRMVGNLDDAIRTGSPYVPTPFPHRDGSGNVDGYKPIPLTQALNIVWGNVTNEAGKEIPFYWRTARQFVNPGETADAAGGSNLGFNAYFLANGRNANDPVLQQQYFPQAQAQTVPNSEFQKFADQYNAAAEKFGSLGPLQLLNGATAYYQLNVLRRTGHDENGINASIENGVRRELQNYYVDHPSQFAAVLKDPAKVLLLKELGFQYSETATGAVPGGNQNMNHSLEQIQRARQTGNYPPNYSVRDIESALRN
jgi:hypothetical protein